MFLVVNTSYQVRGSFWVVKNRDFDDFPTGSTAPAAGRRIFGGSKAAGSRARGGWWDGKGIGTMGKGGRILERWEKMGKIKIYKIILNTFFCAFLSFPMDDCVLDEIRVCIALFKSIDWKIVSNSFLLYAFSWMIWVMSQWFLA